MYPPASANGHVTAPMQVVPVNLVPQQQQFQQQPMMQPVQQFQGYQQAPVYQQQQQPVMQPQQYVQAPVQYQQPAQPVIPANFVLPPFTGHQAAPQVDQTQQQQQQQVQHPFASEYQYLAQRYRKTPEEVRRIVGEDPSMVQAVMSQVNEQIAAATRQQPVQQQQVQPVQAPAAPAFDQTYKMPQGWQNVLRKNNQGMWEAAAPQYAQLAAMQNHNEQVAATRVVQFGQDPAGFLTQDQQVQKYLQEQIQQGVRAQFEQHQEQLTLQQFGQQFQQELIFPDPSTGRPMMDPTTGQILATPTGHAFRLRTESWRKAGMKMTPQALHEALMLSRLDVQRAQAMQQQPGQGQFVTGQHQQQQFGQLQAQPPQTMNFNPVYGQQPPMMQQQPGQWGQPMMAPMQQQQPWQTAANDVQQIVNMNKGWNSQYPGANQVMRQQAPTDMTFEQAFYQATADMPDGLTADQYAERVFNFSGNRVGSLFG